MSQETLFKKNLLTSDSFDKKSDVILRAEDTFLFTKRIPDNVVDLVVSSPPYNIGKEYEKKTSIDEYFNWIDPILFELVRVLNPGGSLCWQVGNHVDDGEIFPLDIFFYEKFKKLGLKLRNRIIWHFEHGLHASKRFSGRYETLLWFTKSDSYTFNLDPVRVPSKYPGKRHFKGPNKGLPSGNPLGKNPSDFWKLIQEEWEEGLWEFPNVKSNHPEKMSHPCQFPIELVERCVLALTVDGGLVFDPFLGSGSSIIASIKNGRRGMGVDQCIEYIDLTKKRIDLFSKGELKVRPLGKAVHSPSGKEKVSQTPQEWLLLGEENASSR